MIVAFKELLNAGSLQFCLLDHHLLRVGILPLAIGVLGVKVVFRERWHKWRLHLLLHEGLPVEVGEPLMRLQLTWTLLAESAARLALDQSINEVSSLVTPVTWYVLLVNLDLLR